MFPSLEVASHLATIVACVPILVALGVKVGRKLKGNKPPLDEEA